MILIADSGSTKCDWVLISQDHSRIDTQTAGINPFFQNEYAILEHISSNEILAQNKDLISSVFFYGAGCSSDNMKMIVANALRSIFKNANEVLVDHDMAGAVFALSNGKPGVCCILGTGSNSIFFDGEKLIEKVPSTGFILGDEGSGAYFGKYLVSKWLYNALPDKLQEEFGETYQLNKDKILQSVYREANPNRYLAKFSNFMTEHREHPYVQQLLKKGFAEFLAIHVWCYEGFRNYPIHFTGSISYHFQDELKSVATQHGITIGNVIKNPIEGMVNTITS